MSDNVSHPSHYNQGKIEVIEFIEDQKLGYHLGNAIKYICRAGKKNLDTHLEDLEKAHWYIKRAIINRQAELEGRTPVRPNEMSMGVKKIIIHTGICDTNHPISQRCNDRFAEEEQKK